MPVRGSGSPVCLVQAAIIASDGTSVNATTSRSLSGVFVALWWTCSLQAIHHSLHIFVVEGTRAMRPGQMTATLPSYLSYYLSFSNPGVVLSQWGIGLCYLCLLALLLRFTCSHFSMDFLPFTNVTASADQWVAP
jgi:hypothetical protein